MLNQKFKAMITTAITSDSAKSELGTLQMVLKLTFSLVPIVAGADKFTNFLTDWSKYLNPDLMRIVPFDPHTFMIIVGVIEIIAGIIVFIKTELGAYIVSAWLICIALTLLLSGSYLDVAVRDIVMAIGAWALARISIITKHTNA
jgi:hypothetical protein